MPGEMWQMGVQLLLISSGSTTHHTSSSNSTITSSRSSSSRWGSGWAGAAQEQMLLQDQVLRHTPVGTQGLLQLTAVLYFRQAIDSLLPSMSP